MRSLEVLFLFMGTSKNSFCRDAQSFDPILQFEKLKIRPVFLRSPSFDLRQNLRASNKKLFFRGALMTVEENLLPASTFFVKDRKYYAD